MADDQTRAQIARRRLAQLVASFDEQVPGAVSTNDVTSPPDPPSAPHPPGAHLARESTAPRLRVRITGLHARLVVALAVGGAIVLTWFILADRPRGGSPEMGYEAATVQSPAEQAATVTETGQIVVDVAGHVQHPGIVTLPAGSRVHEAIEAAGGVVGDVDTTGVNLARILVDGEQILVGIAPVAPAGSDASSGSGGGVINLNTATVDLLDELPGVGPVTAQAIVQWRQDHGSFRTVDDLLEVSGIGEATLEKLRDLVTI